MGMHGVIEIRKDLSNAQKAKALADALKYYAFKIRAGANIMRARIDTTASPLEQNQSQAGATLNGMHLDRFSGLGTLLFGERLKNEAQDAAAGATIDIAVGAGMGAGTGVIAGAVSRRGRKVKTPRLTPKGTRVGNLLFTEKYFSDTVGGTLGRSQLASIEARLKKDLNTKVFYNSERAKLAGKNFYHKGDNEIHLLGGNSKQPKGMFYEEVQHAYDHHAGKYDGINNNSKLHAVTAREMAANQKLRLTAEQRQRLLDLAERFEALARQSGNQ